MSAALETLQPELLPYARELVRAAGAAGLLPQITSTRRSHAEQRRLYSRYLNGQQPYPVARPGTSAHEYGWAFDMVVSPLSSLREAGRYWQRLGGVWGGRPTRKGSGYDPVHFEYPGWRNFVDWRSEDIRSTQDHPSTQESLGLLPYIPTFALADALSGGRVGSAVRAYKRTLVYRAARSFDPWTFLEEWLGFDK